MSDNRRVGASFFLLSGFMRLRWRAQHSLQHVILFDLRLWGLRVVEPSELFPLTLPPDDAMLRAIAHVAVQWGYLEYEIDQEIKALLKFPQNAGEEMNFGLPFAKRTKKWRKLASKAYSADLYSEVESISSRAKVIKRHRDAVVHGVYAGGEEGVSRTSYRYAELIDYVDTSVEDIDKVAQQISAIGADMLRHFIRVSRETAEEPPEPKLRLP